MPNKIIQYCLLKEEKKYGNFIFLDWFPGSNHIYALNFQCIIIWKPNIRKLQNFKGESSKNFE